MNTTNGRKMSDQPALPFGADYQSARMTSQPPPDEWQRLRESAGVGEEKQQWLEK